MLSLTLVLSISPFIIFITFISSNSAFNISASFNVLKSLISNFDSNNLFSHPKIFTSFIVSK